MKAREQQTVLLTFVEPGLPTHVRGDAARLRQVLLNLLGNAVKFTREGEVVLRVTLDTIAPTQAVLRFAVSDTGIGLSADAQARLFQPFAQADGSTTCRFGGTGLGLVISKRLVELMGGDIKLHSVESQGRTFWFSVPLARVAIMPDTSMAGEHGAGDGRALVVDSSAASRAIMQRYLEAFGRRSDVASNAEEALMLLRRAAVTGNTYALVFVEATLLDMDGPAFLRSMHDIPALADLPLVLMTAFDEPRLRAVALQAGFAGYLPKPVKHAHLRDLHQRVVAGESHSLGPAMHGVGSITPPMPAMDQRQFILVADDNPVNQKLALAQLHKLGYRAEAVGDGRAAVAAVATKQYALVLMDCQMPGLDGYEATAAIRAIDQSGARIPIIAMTADAITENRERCFQAGMDDYLIKPVKLDLLRARLDHWLVPRARGELPTEQPTIFRAREDDDPVVSELGT